MRSRAGDTSWALPIEPRRANEVAWADGRKAEALKVDDVISHLRQPVGVSNAP